MLRIVWRVDEARFSWFWDCIDMSSLHIPLNDSVNEASKNLELVCDRFRSKSLIEKVSNGGAICTRIFRWRSYGRWPNHVDHVGTSLHILSAFEKHATASFGTLRRPPSHRSSNSCFNTCAKPCHKPAVVRSWSLRWRLQPNVWQRICRWPQWTYNAWYTKQ